MPNDVTILKGGDVRIFVQEDGESPASPYIYYGCLSLDGPEQDLGEPDPVYCPSPDGRNTWAIVDLISKVPALGSTDFTQHADRFLRDVWWSLKDRGCMFNMQAVVGRCQRPDDFTQWDAKLLFTNVRLTKLGLGALNVLSGDDNAAVDITGSLSFKKFGPIQQLSFAREGDATVLAEVLDGLYNDAITCGECGTPSNGCQRLYWLTVANPGSPGLSSQIVYSKDNGATWAALDIPVFSGLSGNRVAAVGARLVVISQAKGGHAYELFTDVDAGTVAWTLSTSGYVAGKSPRAIYSKTPYQTYVAAQGGYIYFMDDPSHAVVPVSDGSETTQDLNDIHGYAHTVVAVGGNNAVLVSNNDGESFSLVTGPAVGVNLTAIWVLNTKVWFIGTGNGKLYYTIDGGTTWTQISFGCMNT